MQKLFEVWKIIVIYTLVGLIWQLLEIVTVKEIQPSWADTIIGAVFALSIYFCLNRIPHKAIMTSYDSESDIYWLVCPKCKSTVGELDNEDGDGIYKYNIHENFCSSCGTRIRKSYTESDYKRWGV